MPRSERPGTATTTPSRRQQTGLYKTELIKPQGPWRTVEHVEIATLEWVDWFNHHRLYEHCGDIPPAELEALYYGEHGTQRIAEFSN